MQALTLSVFSLCYCHCQECDSALRLSLYGTTQYSPLLSLHTITKETMFISTTIEPETYSTVYGFQQLSAACVHVSAPRRVYLCLAVQEADAPRDPGLSHGESPPPGCIFNHGTTSLMALFISPRNPCCVFALLVYSGGIRGNWYGVQAYVWLSGRSLIYSLI